MANSHTWRRHVVTLGLVLALLALIAYPLWLDAGRPGDGERFAGSDSQAMSLIETDHPAYQPWFQPFFAPSSGQIESGLFALQAAIGAGVLGYAIGALRMRRRYEADQVRVDSR